ncbi:hypothetical protein VMCG_04703 [Cytospora schulzeri]|uniref:JmjC domain-containing protein n=1 Tax=Cytospora schulzeri TaxID=448051 RepID=A0A423WRS4_9PEZI|nr:hypothetical protein VMCG_04703 [Valsa malicola]
MEQSPVDPLAELITTFNELNSPVIEELDGEPSPLEFMRYVSRNTPFVVRNAAATWTATKTWNAQYLEESLRDQTVNVAVTPKGHDETGELVFAKPWEEDQAFPEFLDYVRRQETDASFPKGSEIRYAQTQNDNLRHEYVSLFNQVQRDIPFARIALEKEPEAINMWIGNSHSVTALHKDNYENIYVQIQGQKHFVLLPPHSYSCVNEKPLRPGTYAREDDRGGLGLVMDAGEGGQEAENVPFAIWDPDFPDDNATPYSRLAEPMRVTLEQGDMLYLPAMWYDMEFSGPLYPLTSFVMRSHCVPPGGMPANPLHSLSPPPPKKRNQVEQGPARAPAPAASGGDADFQYDLLNLLRRTVVQLTRIADVTEGSPELDSQSGSACGNGMTRRHAGARGKLNQSARCGPRAPGPSLLGVQSLLSVAN